MPLLWRVAAALVFACSHISSSSGAIAEIGEAYYGGARTAEAELSEYQYYEFRAIDRPLDATDRKALRAISTRARLSAVEADAIAPDELEPLSGIAPVGDALGAFADFFVIDADLVAAAAEQPDGASATEAPSSAMLRSVVSALPEGDKDAHVASELRALVRARLASEAPATPRRTAG